MPNTGVSLTIKTKSVNQILNGGNIDYIEYLKLLYETKPINANYDPLSYLH